MKRQTLSLKMVVARCLVTFQPVAVKQHSFLLNEIPADFMVTADEKILSSLVFSIFNGVVGSTWNSCIRVSAKKFGGIVLLKFRNRNREIAYDTNRNGQHIILLTEKLGASIFSSDSTLKTGALTLSFPTISNVA